MTKMQANNGTWFRYPYNFEGKVDIQLPTGEQFQIDGQDLLQVVATGFLIPKKIAQLENMGWKDAFYWPI